MHEGDFLVIYRVAVSHQRWVQKR